MKISLMDFDRLFAESTNSKVIGLVPPESQNKAKQFISELFSQDDDIDFIAECSCGELVGNYFEGAICPSCGTECKSVSDEINIKLFVDIPEYLPALIQPAAYRVMNKAFGTDGGRHSLLDKIIDTTLPEPSVDVPRGWANFETHFDDIVKKIVETRPNKVDMGVLDFIRMYRDRIFVRKIPILNDALHMCGKTGGTLSYVDDSSQYILKMVVELSSIVVAHDRTPMLVEHTMTSIHSALIEYVTSIIKSKLNGKTGFFRKCVMGFRLCFTYRAVITPITIKCMADELHLPWRIGITELKLEIIGALISRYKMTLKEALQNYHRAKFQRVEIIAQIMKDLISECPYKGLPTMFGRNPSMIHGNNQLFFITIIKDDLDDNTIGINPMVLKAPNGDFDGDACFGGMVKEMGEVPKLMKIHPSTTILGADTLRLTPLVNITPQARLAVNKWLQLDC